MIFVYLPENRKVANLYKNSSTSMILYYKKKSDIMINLSGIIQVVIGCYRMTIKRFLNMKKFLILREFHRKGSYETNGVFYVLRLS